MGIFLLRYFSVLAAHVDRVWLGYPTISHMKRVNPVYVQLFFLFFGEDFCCCVSRYLHTHIHIRIHFLMDFLLVKIFTGFIV